MTDVIKSITNLKGWGSTKYLIWGSRIFLHVQLGYNSLESQSQISSIKGSYGGGGGGGVQLSNLP